MKNPIVNNRLVKDITFATRLLSFVKDIEVNDACSEDERDSMISYATSLLKYQVRTATNTEEIDYLKRVGVYDKFPPNTIKTYHGSVLDLEGDCVELYTCMKVPPVGDQVLVTSTCKLLKNGVKSNRLYFRVKNLCKIYIENNKPKYSENEVQTLINQK